MMTRHAQLSMRRTRSRKTIVQAQANYGPALCVLGLIDAGLGRKEQALREGRRAVELVRGEKDALVGPTMIKYLAVIAAWVGETDLACNQLALLIRDPSTVSYRQLKLMPFWDPLRGDPRFEKIVEEAKEPVATTVPAKSIAVLPFENLSRDPDNAYFAEGIQDEILTRLSKIADLKVISRTSTRQYKERACKCARHREATWGGLHCRRKCAKERRRRARKRAINQSSQRLTCLGGYL